MDEPRCRPLDRTDFRLILVLMLLTAGMRLWQVTHTEVLARDSIGYIRLAWEIDNLGWRAAITSPTVEQHPGYPLTVLAAHRVFGSWLGDDVPVAWQIAAQIASSLASILLVLPVYLFARRLFDPGIAFASVVLLQSLPAIGRLMGDGLSEAVFLVFAATAFWAGLRAFDTGKVSWFLLCGLSSGLAYFVRPEGLLIAFCTGLVLLGRQCWKASRQAWRPWLAQGAGVSVGALLCVAIFVAATGKFSTKSTVGRFYDDLTTRPGESTQVAPPTAGPLLAAWSPTKEWNRDERIVWAAEQVGFMLVRATLYFGWVFGLVGMWWYRDRLAQPGGVVILLVSGLIALLVYRVAWFLGYLSDRHLALIVLTFVPFIAAGLVTAGRLIPRCQAWLPVVFVLALAGPAAYRTLLPLHDDRDGFRVAGQWLASHTLPGDKVEDPFSWTHYYAGRVFVERGHPAPASMPPVKYVVREKGGPSDHQRLSGTIKLLEEEIKKGQRVQSWELRRGSVEVWAVPSGS
jgi:hypothetical protein